MSNLTVNFIKSALLYFLLAVLLGVYMTLNGPVYPNIQVHTHMNLLGWMSMMIFGVGYHILPRFSGRPLWSERLGLWHLYLANIGLIGMVFSWYLYIQLLPLFASIEAISAIMFIVNMLKTVQAVKVDVTPKVPPKVPPGVPPKA